MFHLKLLVDKFPSDGNEDESDDYLDDILVRSMETDPCTSSDNELR